MTLQRYKRSELNGSQVMKIRIQTSIIAIVAALGFSGVSARAATNIFSVGNNGAVDYTINGINDPDLTLVRGFTYYFNISVASFHAFYIKTAQINGTGSAYND